MADAKSSPRSRSPESSPRSPRHPPSLGSPGSPHDFAEEEDEAAISKRSPDHSHSPRSPRSVRGSRAGRKKKRWCRCPTCRCCARCCPCLNCFYPDQLLNRQKVMEDMISKSRDKHVNVALVEEQMRNDRENIAVHKRKWGRRWTICSCFLFIVSAVGAIVAILVLAIAPWALLNEGCDWQPRAYFGAVYTPDGRLLVVGGQGVDSNFGDVWESDKKAEKWSLLTDAAEFGPRHGHELLHIAGAGELIVIAGSRGSSDALNDVWRSTDGGKQWMVQISNAPWPARKFLAAAVDADGVIYITGGLSGYGGAGLNDIWRSRDTGRSWSPISLGAPWTARHSFAFVRLPGGTRPGRFYILGGDDGQLKHDVWLSDDVGRVWDIMRFTHTREMRYSVSEERASWSPRAQAMAVADGNGLLTLTGGRTTSSSEPFSNEIWQLEAPPSDDVAWQNRKSSEDRLNRLRQPLEWQSQASPPWSARRGHQSIVDDEGVPYVFGGEDIKGFNNDAWKMTSSIAWVNLEIAFEKLRLQVLGTFGLGEQVAEGGPPTPAPLPPANESAV